MWNLAQLCLDNIQVDFLQKVLKGPGSPFGMTEAVTWSSSTLVSIHATEYFNQRLTAQKRTRAK